MDARNVLDLNKLKNNREGAIIASFTIFGVLLLNDFRCTMNALNSIQQKSDKDQPTDQFQ